MKRYIVWTSDYREFPVIASSIYDAKRQVINALNGRCTIVGVKEVH